MSRRRRRSWDGRPPSVVGIINFACGPCGTARSLKKETYVNRLKEDKRYAPVCPVCKRSMLRKG